jgi:phosphoribosylglycinamide formyltransferase-1
MAGRSPLPRVAILISGGGSNMVRLVEDMQSAGYAAPVLVLSNRPKAGGLAKAEALGVPVAVVDHTEFAKDRSAFEADVIKALDFVAPDIICLAGFMRILSAEFVDRYAGRVLNIHPSLLPKYKGLSTHARAIEAGDAEAGCSVHLVTPDLDDGPVLGQARVAIDAGETPDTLAAKVLVEEHKLYRQVLRDFAAELAS